MKATKEASQRRLGWIYSSGNLDYQVSGGSFKSLLGLLSRAASHGSRRSGFRMSLLSRFQGGGGILRVFPGVVAQSLVAPCLGMLLSVFVCTDTRSWGLEHQFLKGV
jgi:hypothetical protein